MSTAAVHDPTRLTPHDTLRAPNHNPADTLGRLSRLIRRPRGTQVFAPHNLGGLLYMVRDGAVALTSADADGHQLTIARLDQGAVFSAPTHDDRMTLHAEAVTDAWLYVIPSGRMPELMAAEPQLGAHLVAELTKTLHQTQELSHQLAHWNVDRRLAHRIAQLAQTWGRPTLDGHVVITQIVTHADLADMIGATRQTVSQSLSRLARCGIVARRRRRLVVLDAAGLERFGTRADECQKALSLSSSFEAT